MSAAGWYDLTRPIYAGMPVYPGDPDVTVQTQADYDPDGYLTSVWRMGSHTGTHVDAPKHFLTDGIGTDRLPLDALIGTAHLADVRQRGKNAEITAADLAAALPCRRLLICTGWDERWGRDDYYTHPPGLSASAVNAVIAAGVRLLGFDTPNIHATEWARRHQALLGSGVVLVEALYGLTRLLPAQRAYLVVAPLLLRNSDGAPARVFARIDANLESE
ncbi:MAG TPA: cyclase family protein [Firmicutes bacterium]|nr:cyclase family protein [Bacillota bacterium]